MIPQHTNERFFEALIAGDRPVARAIVNDLRTAGVDAADLLGELFWPTYENLMRLHKKDQIGTLPYHMATRLLRMLVDQNSVNLPSSAPRNRTIFACCGPSEAEEMGGQMAVDMLESAGFTVHFAGGGIANDEVLAQVNQHRPDVLLMFSSAPSDLPNIRQLIDHLREIGACPNLQIAVGGGVFNRAEGLAEEIGADLWATSPREMAETLIEEPMRRADAEQRTVGKNRKLRKVA